MGDPSVPPNSTIRTQQATRYSRSTFGAPGASPPTPAFGSDIFGQTSTAGTAQIFSTSPTAERHPTERKATMPSLTASTSDPHGLGNGTYPAVLIRRLPASMSPGELNSLLTFATDLLQADFTASPYHNDHGFAAAIAYFKTPAGASDAQQKLHNKPNATRDANMIVEDVYNQANVAYERRNTIDSLAPRTQTSSASSASSGSGPSGRSRYGSTFHSNDKVSPPLPTPGSGSDFPPPGNSHHWNNLFSPQSPLANGPNGSHRVTGKSMINDDNGDDETGELLKDPVAYAKNGQRRQTHSAIPVGRLASLSLSSAPGAPYSSGNATSNGYATQRSLQSTTSSVSPANVHGSGQNPAVMNMNTRMLPPANPADQNPPCNTLYVGNLPIDTSEDELKGLFSKQRGYKRLCFRTKANGPMCFVEFEDISFATKALHDLYGHLLHNSVKGGIRLSFSKNPLGVRAGQTNGLGPNTVMSPQAMSPGYGLMSSVSGPPPGLGSPSGLLNVVGSVPFRPIGTLDSASSNPFSVSASDYVPQVARNQYSGGVPPHLGNGTYPRDTRSGFVNGQNEYYQNQNGFSYSQHNANEYQSGGHNYNIGR